MTNPKFDPRQHRRHTGARAPKRPVAIDPAALAIAETLRINDAVQISGLCRSSLYKLMDSGRLPSVLILGRRLIPRAGLVTLLRGDAP